MKSIRAMLLVLAALLTTGVATEASANGHGHSSVHFGFAFGPGYWPGYGPGYYAPYYYPPYAPYAYGGYYPPVAAAGPTTYVEQGPVEAAPQQQALGSYWYYCRQSNAYYPYVNSCAGAWERVPARPAQ